MSSDAAHGPLVHKVSNIDEAVRELADAMDVVLRLLNVVTTPTTARDEAVRELADTMDVILELIQSVCPGKIRVNAGYQGRLSEAQQRVNRARELLGLAGERPSSSAR